MPVPLPIDDVLPDLVVRLREAGAAVLVAPTGAGKTTRVPPALLPLGDGAVLLVEPRRVAARAAARRMADEGSSRVGGRIGYHVRFDKQTSNEARIAVVTPGILLRRLHDDPFLDGVSAVVFDEFHERGLETDLALGLVRLVRRTVRPDLRVVVMSATLDPGPIAAYMGGCPTIESRGRTYPVAVRYEARQSLADSVSQMLAETAGDVLVFLPGVREIRQAMADLGPAARRNDLLLLPLYGDLPPDEQDRALKPHDRRKVVLATNVAEASVTVEGVTAVVDTGVARQLEFDPALGLDRLRITLISRSSADQRVGRAGRTRPGIAVRLWDEQAHRARPADAEPEVRRVDLSGAVLALAALGEPAFEWLEAPRPAAVDRATALLRTLGALDGAGTITDAGRRLAALPIPPRVGRLLTVGHMLGVPGSAAVAAALLTERDPFPSPPGRPGIATDSDLLDRVEAVETYLRTGHLGPLHPAGADGVARAANQFRRLLNGRDDPAAGPDALLRAVFAAYPDRLIRRRSPGDSRGLMVGGRGVRLGPQSGVRDAELFVGVDVDAGEAESVVRLASVVRREWLPLDLLTTAHEVTFDPTAEKLLARKVTRYLDLPTDDVPGHFADGDTAAVVLADAALARLAGVLPAPDTPAGQFRIRVMSLAGWLPDADLPALADDDLRDVLAELCRGRRSLAEVRSGPWLDALRGRLTFHQMQLVEREAPAALTVPSGSQITLTYQVGRPPVLAARIQELFGLSETPRVAGGRVKVLLHLLAPNGRPQQVTDDLGSFWATGYATVRKELRARYPRHNWPDDPLAAEATRGPRRRP